jgi:hypothetical protein
VIRCAPTRRARRRARRRGLRCGSRPRPYTSPRRNPFVGKPGRDQIYAWGLRNPWRYSFDSGTGAIAIGDVGQGCMEEIDYRGRGRARGANFGWPRYEGTVLYDDTASAPGAIPPIHQYNNVNATDTPSAPCPDAGGFSGTSVVAGYVVRDARLTSQYGRLLYGDASGSQIRSLIPRESGALDDQWTGVALPGAAPYSFAEGGGRRLYVVAGAGPVLRLDPP